METTDSLTLIAARIRAACDTYRICGLIGRGCLKRVRRIGRLVDAGRIDPAAGMRLALEAEAVAFMLAPIPGGHS